MSREVEGLVSRKQCGGPVRRCLLLAMASIGGNDGRDIYTSVSQLARDSEVDARTVQRTLKAFLIEGLAEHVGQRKCPRGYTNEYRLVMSAIHAMPNILRREDMEAEHPRRAVTPGNTPPRQRVTPDTSPPLTNSRPSKAKAPETSGDIAYDPRRAVTPGEPPPPAQRHPTLFPSTTENPSVESSVVADSELKSDEQRPISPDWNPKPELRERALGDLKFTEGELSDAIAEFVEWWRAKSKRKDGRKTQRGWNAAFGTRLNDLAARWRTQYRKDAPGSSSARSGHQHGGDAILNAVARRRGADQAQEHVPSRSDDWRDERVA